MSNVTRNVLVKIASVSSCMSYTKYRYSVVTLEFADFSHCDENSFNDNVRGPGCSDY